MLIQDKVELKFNRIKQQFGCGYYLVCCRDDCPCIFKSKDYNPEIMKKLKKEFDMKTTELFG